MSNQFYYQISYITESKNFDYGSLRKEVQECMTFVTQFVLPHSYVQEAEEKFDQLLDTLEEASREEGNYNAELMCSRKALALLKEGQAIIENANQFESEICHIDEARDQLEKIEIMLLENNQYFESQKELHPQYCTMMKYDDLRKKFEDVVLKRVIDELSKDEPPIEIIKAQGREALVDYLVDDDIGEPAETILAVLKGISIALEKSANESYSHETEYGYVQEAIENCEEAIGILSNYHYSTEFIEYVLIEQLTTSLQKLEGFLGKNPPHRSY